MRLRASTTILACTLSITATLAAGEENREQGPHQHGHGTFEMAIEKQTVSIELRVPGNDIVGFEHAPKTDKDKAAIDAATKKLGDALALFGIPADAGCKVQDADIHLHGAGEDGHDHGDHKHDDKPAAAKDGDKHDHDHDRGAGHASFHAKYTLACTKPAAITGLAFKFFDVFPGSQELDIVAISEKAQVKAEATRKAPAVSLKGLW